MRSFSKLATCVASASMASLSFAATVSIQNPSFESADMGPCVFGGPVPGWQAQGTWGTWNPGSGNECGHLFGFYEAIPDGDQTGFVNSVNSPIWQELSHALQPNTMYTLSVDVGRRADGFPMKHYRIQLLAGDVLIAEDDDVLDPALGTFETSVICAEIGDSHPALGQPLEIRLFLIEGPQANFDNVHLDAGPLGGECAFTGGVVGDIDGSGAVDGADLGMLLGSWGECIDCDDCPADLTGDCVVDGADLGLLLGSWS
jgi:hypothetical protein